MMADPPTLRPVGCARLESASGAFIIRSGLKNAVTEARATDAGSVWWAADPDAGLLVGVLRHGGVDGRSVRHFAEGDWHARSLDQYQGSSYHTSVPSAVLDVLGVDTRSADGVEGLPIQLTAFAGERIIAFSRPAEAKPTLAVGPGEIVSGADFWSVRPTTPSELREMRRSGMSPAAIADELGVGEMTIYRWLDRAAIEREGLTGDRGADAPETGRSNPIDIDGATIREQRKDAGLTQIDLADLLGVANTTISQWESNENPPSGEQAQRLLEWLSDQRD